MAKREGKGNSLIAFPNEYVVVDIETTGLDYEYDEIIEVAALKVNGDEVVGSYTSLIHPMESHSFEETELIPDFISDLTGITNEMLFAAPSIDKVLPVFLEFIGDLPIIGHNVNFDVNFIFDAASQFGKVLSNDFIDTMRISRKLYPDLAHHRLVDIVKKTGVDVSGAHRAVADVNATLSCYIAMKREIICNIGIPAFIESFQHFYSYDNSLKDIQPTVSDIDTTNPIYGKVIVFTGALSSMSRKEAFQVVVNMGGIPKNSVTQNTNILVVGKEEFAASVKNGRTNKMQKADEYASKGLDIITLSEDTFFDMLSMT